MVDLEERRMPTDKPEEAGKPEPVKNGTAGTAAAKAPTAATKAPAEDVKAAERKQLAGHAAERDRGFTVEPTDPETSLTIKRLRSNGTFFRSLLLISLTGILLYPLPISILPVKLLLLLIVAYLTMQNLQLAGYQRAVKAIGRGAYATAFIAFTFHVVAFLYVLARVSMIVMILQ